MNRLPVSLGVSLLLLAGCGEGSDPKDRESPLSRLVIAAGYKVTGIPQYDGVRWTTSVRVPDCRAKVIAASNEVAKSKDPKSFKVLSVGGTPLKDLSPGTDPTNISASKLKKLPKVAKKLDCVE